MADKVSILDKDGVVTYYSTYGAARAAIISLSIEHPLIQIWATLTNEQIVLLNGVDIWIAPGVTIDYLPPSLTTAAPTITDNGVECHCQIYGTGVIKNTFVGTTGNVYECIKITNVDTKLEVNCDYIEGVGKVSDGFAGVSIRIENGEKFHLTCNKVYNQNNVAMYIGSSNLINDINFRIGKVETGIPSTTDTGSTAIITNGNGYIKINEILCRNLGHCLSHRGGKAIAQIKKLTTIFNTTNSNEDSASTVHQAQGLASQTLILYFDKISAIHGNIPSRDGVEISQGTVILIGRSIFSTDLAALEIVGANTKGYIKCNELISSNSNGLGLNSFTNQITLDINYIEGNNGDAGAVFVAGAANFILKNAKCKNLAAGSESRTFWIIPEGVVEPNIIFNNVKIISNGYIIFFNQTQFGNIDIKNFGLFTNKDIDDNIILKIGTEGNFQYISDSDLT